MVARLYGGSAAAVDVEPFFERFGVETYEERVDRIRAVTSKLPSELRGLSFKLAKGLDVSDLDADHYDNDLPCILADALELDDDTCDTIESEIQVALDAAGEAEAGLTQA